MSLSAIAESLASKVTLFGCCACCVKPHAMPHADGCARHQRAEVAESKRKTRRPVTTVAAL